MYFLPIFSEKSQKKTSTKITWCVFSLSGSDLGSVSDLLGQSPELGGVQSLALHLPAWKPLHGRPGPELQQLSGASGHGGQSESSTSTTEVFSLTSPLLWQHAQTARLLPTYICDKWYPFSHFQRVAEEAESEGYVQTSFLDFVLNVCFLCVCVCCHFF